MPDPTRRKKSLEAQRAQQVQGHVGRSSGEDIPLREFGGGGAEGGRGAAEQGLEQAESPQVFVFDEVNGRYVKERSPTG